MDVLRPLFGDRLISRFADTPWPPRSPDLSMCDYFLWGNLKARVYSHMPRTLDDLKRAIRVEVAQIDGAMLERVETNFKQRLRLCINENGHHMKDVIFHTWLCKMLITCIHIDVNIIWLKLKLTILCSFQNHPSSLPHPVLTRSVMPLSDPSLLSFGTN